MRKQTKRKQITPRAPMLVVMSQVPELSITERLSAEAFAGGWAQTDHFDNLADCRDILMFAAADLDDKPALEMCEKSLNSLMSIKDRYARTSKFGCTGDELKVLRELVHFSESFWITKGGDLFARCYDALKRARLGHKTGELK